MGNEHDAPTAIYQYSRDDVRRKWQFSELHPSRQEQTRDRRPSSGGL